MCLSSSAVISAQGKKGTKVKKGQEPFLDRNGVMKHAGQDTLGRLKPFIIELRKRFPLREKSAGVFYLKSKAFLHFHDDPAEIFADVKLDLTTYSRHPVTTIKEQQALLRSIDKCLSSMQSGSASICNPLAVKIG